MKLLIGLVTALLALCWTLGAWAAAAVLGWAAALPSPGDTAELGRVVAAWDIPAWVTTWIDPAALHALLRGVVWALDELQQGWPGVSAVLGWLVPVTWIIWGLGMVLLLSLAAFGLWLAGRLRPAPLARPA